MEDQTILGLLGALGTLGVGLFGWNRKDVSELRNDHEALAKSHSDLHATVLTRADFREELRDFERRLTSRGHYQAD